MDRSSYVDRYTKWDVVLLLTIFMLNVGDAYFTMRWLSRGGREANPVMDFFLDIGPTAFLVQKCLVVGGWLLILLVHKNFRFARLGLYASLAVYLVLMIVHFGIVLLGVEPPTPEEILKAETEREAARIAVESDFDRNGGEDGRLDAAYRATLPSRNAGPFRFKTDAQSTSE